MNLISLIKGTPYCICRVSYFCCWTSANKNFSGQKTEFVALSVAQAHSLIVKQDLYTLIEQSVVF